MKTKYHAGLIGCGDFLRWLIDDMNGSQLLRVKSTFDLDPAKSKKRAGELGATPVKSAEDIFGDPEISVVYIFTPPFAREEYFTRAVETKKHILTTKPLAPRLEEAEKLLQLTRKKGRCSVIYGRTGNSNVETIKKILDSGEIGHLALYKEDWFHHYPTWNKWATDPEKNGGPFMDAMIHNLNKSRYLIGSKPVAVTYISENLAQSLPCNDTEWMKIDFENGASSYLFITWAGDYQVFDPTGNEREHIGPLELITDRGWIITETEENGFSKILAKKENETRSWPVEPLNHTPYDQFILDVMEEKPSLVDIRDAMEDIRIMDAAIHHNGKRTNL